LIAKWLNHKNFTIKKEAAGDKALLFLDPRDPGIFGFETGCR